MTETRMIMYKHYSIDELEKTDFWHRVEPDGVDFKYVYNNERKCAYFMPNNKQLWYELIHTRKMNNYKRTIFKRKIVSALLDKTKLWLPELKKIIYTFIGFDSYSNSIKMNDYGYVGKGIPFPLKFQKKDLLVIDDIEEQQPTTHIN